VFRLATHTPFAPLPPPFALLSVHVMAWALVRMPLARCLPYFTPGISMKTASAISVALSRLSYNLITA